jgi:DeoR/GlpR family transcriptional regulator of sugar metabolism
VQAQRKLLRRSENVVVMADSSKLRRKSAMIVAALDKVRTLVTDDGASAEELDTFRAAGVEVIVASIVPDELRKQGG